MQVTPYETPITQQPPVRSPLSQRAVVALLLSLTPVVATALCLLLGDLMTDLSIRIIFSLCAAAGLVATGLGAFTAFRLVRTGRVMRPRGLWAAVTATLLGPVASFLSACAVWVTMVEFTRGRQLRKRGRPVFAPIDEEGSHWAPEAPVTDGAEAPQAVADAWRTNGSTEHASVASFAQLSMDLMSLGAPPKLIEDAHRDALDEMKHTELCFSLARSLDGRAIGPAAFSAVSTVRGARGPRALTLARLAVDSLIDGAINEGVSARVVAELAKEVTEPRVQPVLAQIARDEARHAAHGFDVMRWCLASGGETVRAALETALVTLPATPAEHLTAMPDGERWGLPSKGRIDAAYTLVRARVVARTRRLLAAA